MLGAIVFHFQLSHFHLNKLIKKVREEMDKQRTRKRKKHGLGGPPGHMLAPSPEAG